jgi:hypothetical protein
LPADGTIFVDAGRYRLHAMLADYEDVDSEVVVEAGEETSLSFELHPRSTWIESPWLWIAFGAAAVAGVTTAIVVASRSDPDTVCISIAGGSCP